jgi:hypothetical protein
VFYNLLGFWDYKNFMSDFNRDDSQAEPSAGQDSRRRKKLSSDELIALFLAFTGIGSILFWTLGQRTSPVNLGTLGSGGAPFMSGDNSRSPSSNGAVNGAADIKADVKTEAKPTNLSGAAPIAAPEEKRRPPASAPAENTTAVPQAQSNQPESPKPESGTVNPDSTKASMAPASVASKATEPKDQGTVEKPGKPKAFSDVPDSALAKPAILALSSMGVINGFEDGTYKPDQPINRGQFAAMVQKAFNKPQIKEAMTFKDIKSGSPMMAAVDEATRSGFMNGYPNGEFKPEQSIPRLEMLSAIATGLNLKPKGDPVQALTKYSDRQDIPKWAISKISSAVDAGIVSPTVTQLEPKKVATRADAASYIYQALVKEGKINP